MVDFVRSGTTLTPSDSELNWNGGRGSFVVSGTFTSVQLLAQFDPTVGPQVIDPALTVTATGVVNFELPNNCILSIIVVGGPPDYVSAIPIMEKGKT